jgi:glucose/arabinose dehydrogenase
MRRLALLTACLACLAAASPAGAQTVQLTPFGGQNFANPRQVASPPGDPDRVFVVESAGAIRLVKGGVTQPAPFLDISGDVHDTCGECGLFSMAFAPDYATSGLFYVFYTRDVSPGLHHLRIEEWKRFAGNPDLADSTSRRVVLDIPHLGAENHNGGQLQFGPDKLLYVWTGDGGSPSSNAQNPGILLGKILRIDPRVGSPYSIPSDNPFGNEVYSYGLRNPWRGSFDRSTGDLTTADVGQMNWEELDFKVEGGGRGANFGWDCFEGFSTFSGCSAPNYSPPVHVYANSGGAAVAGGYVIRDPALPSHAGRYVYADTLGSLGDQLRTINLAAGSGSDAPLGVSLPGIVSFGQDACGHVYAVAGGGSIRRLEPTSGPFPCKLAPDLTLNRTKATARIARTGALSFEARCDEDCDLSTEAVIALGVRKKAKGAKRKKKGKTPKLTLDPLTTRIQLGTAQGLRIELSRKQLRRLRKTMRRGKRVQARIQVSATGGGGGTETESLRVKQTRAKKKGRGKRKRR